MTALAQSPARKEWDRDRVDADAGLPGVAAARGQGRAHAPDARRCTRISRVPASLRCTSASGGCGRTIRVAGAADGALVQSVRAAYDTGPGYGHCSIASNGMWCASWPEREMCEWLIDQGIEFEMHKPLANGRMCDFYFDGVYWEMDGMDRPAEYFAEEVRRPPVRRRHARGLPLPSRAPPGDRPRRERRSDRLDRAGRRSA